ncbi:rhomboid family intramembrane serine protease [Hymenobacter taeanensis]|uniref:Rhomboid family intramembrane serine protease n=1 Tax=Hymenobacter taeanensis TaxID=2735321 RepID=A0A6M6BJV7_9BACT|nr:MULTISPECIES: rhomboid family intramembrane serine protease [Hymenobacter]QJX47603.1 rhomboid family intramembrane serine protease [Hymenobacter taeanensis]UOQ82913.1 rhomboid family intramembrane serine protease [Hymenobacter sp. 5414T-23]
MSIANDIRTAFSRRDNALNQLLLINVLVFVGLVLIEAIMRLTGTYLEYYPNVIRQFQLPADLSSLLRHPWTLLTYAFTHEGFFHILFNLLNLYWFGALVREYLGDRRLVSLYILGALAGAAFFLLSFNLIPALRIYPNVSLLGASASVTAIIMAAATLLPEYTFNLLLIGPVRIKYIAAVVILLSIIAINQGNPGGGIAHIGGALIGFLFIKQLQAGRDLGRPVQAVGEFVGGLLSGRPRLRVTHRNTAAPAAAAPVKKGTLPKPEQDEIDVILDKISRSGYESLSKDEKQKLFRASQK